MIDHELAADLDAVAQAIARMRPPQNSNPEAFHEDRSELASRVRALALRARTGAPPAAADVPAPIGRQRTSALGFAQDLEGRSVPVLVRRAVNRFALVAALVVTGLLPAIGPAASRDRDGRYAASNPALHEWFEHLASSRGLCCSDADGFALTDVDWEVQDKPGSHFRVVVDGGWMDVPDEAVITEPNRFGRAMVWPLRGRS